MGIHTTIYRERDLRPDNRDKYSIKLFKGKKEIKLKNAVSMREEFYFGKSVWAINEWFYQHFLKEYGKAGMEKDESYEWLNEKYIFIDDLKDLLSKIEDVIKEPNRADKILPHPKGLKLCKPRDGTYKNTKRGYIVDKDTKWDNVSRKEMYNGYYYESLKWIKKLLERLIKDDEANKTDLYYEYIVDVG